MKYDALIFDWDGTLLNSADHIAFCMCAAFDDLKIVPPSHEAARNIIGLGMVEAIRQLNAELDDDVIVLIRERYSQHFFRKPMTREDLFEGVLDILDQALSSGFKLAIATGKSRPGMEVALRELAMDKHFHVVRCADETKSKPHPMMLNQILSELRMPVNRALMIGDTEYDMEMARNISMDRLAVTYGVHSRERLLNHAPIGCIDSIQHLTSML
jgi:phosphoglycolate phosphatase